MMKADIEIVTGFIGSGKTTFINALLEDTLQKNENLMVLQFENGEMEIEEKFKTDKRITLINVNYEDITEKKFSGILDKVNPHRVIIEFNGTEEIQSLLDLIHSKYIKSRCKLTCTYYVSEGANFQVYLNNMGRFLLPCVEISNLIVLNNTEDVSKDTIQNINKTLRQYNKFAPVLEIKNKNYMKESLRESNLLHKGFLKRCDLLIKDLFNRKEIHFYKKLVRKKTYSKEKKSGE
jgi:G3E family GTPase